MGNDKKSQEVLALVFGFCRRFADEGLKEHLRKGFLPCCLVGKFLKILGDLWSVGKCAGEFDGAKQQDKGRKQLMRIAKFPKPR